MHLIEFFFFLFFKTEDLSPAFFPTASDMWTTHPALAYSAAAAAAAAAAAELQGQGPGAAAALQHAHAHHAAALAVHPALHPQLPVRFFHQLHALQHSQQQQQQQFGDHQQVCKSVQSTITTTTTTRSKLLDKQNPPSPTLHARALFICGGSLLGLLFFIYFFPA